MPTLKLHYEGWLSLPSALRHRLGLSTGDRLEVELIEGTIVLRPAAKAKHPTPGEDQDVATDSLAPDMPGTLTLTDTAPARRKPGRPRTRDAARECDPAATPKRPRGRPKVVRVPQPEPALERAISAEPWKLRRKVDLQPPAVAAEDASPPSSRPASETRPPEVERRPFRNVEVRKLGPGRSRNRP
jgi:AbrB family looped-hinge helix DNA binding protein